MTRLRFAFIGCGSHASSCLQPCIPLIPELDFVATCDLDEKKAESCARRFGALRSYTDWRRMVEHEQLDAVGICGPPELHLEVGIRCLEAGLHVFLEKPHALSVSDSQRLLSRICCFPGLW
ncbi:MAG: Gfo/Idh/MocA family protein, partial [Armatimonadota bacterium]